MTNRNSNVREAALHVLETIDKQQSYSNLLLNQVIKKRDITGPDVGLLTEIVYGTIQRKMTLDYYLAPFLKKKPENWVRNLLRLSLYQMKYLDKIPDRAVIYEAVEIAKRKGHKGISSFVNGVLRRIQREGTPSLDEIKGKLERISIETSHPLWLVERWHNQYGYEKTKAMCEENLLAPVQTARVNRTKASREEVIEMLLKEDFDVQPSPILSEGIRILRGNVANSQAYKNGLVSIQDESSMLVAHTLDVKPNMKILDACAAPGGKTGHIAELLNNTGQVTAIDLHSHKIKLINDNINRLALRNVKAIVMDSREVNDHFPPNSFDRVLVDAPCSGLGVLKRKPDIKYSKTEQDVLALTNIQQEILHKASKLVKLGGLLIYSTCTVEQEENIRNVEKFLQAHPEFSPHTLNLPTEISRSEVSYVQIFPQDFGGDGFFIAGFKKTSEVL